MEPGEVHTTLRLTEPCDFHVLHIAPKTFSAAANELGVAGAPHNAEVPPHEPRVCEPLRLARARDLLEAHLDEDVPLAELARVAGLSRFETLRMFKQGVGLPPHAFQLQLRLSRARRMLAGITPGAFRGRRAKP